MWTFISHPWGPSCPAYAGGDPIYLNKIKDIKTGDSSCLSEFKSTNHIGTHFDFPAHFSLNGKTVLDYDATNFVYSSVYIFWLDLENDTLITPQILEQAHTKLDPSDLQAELVLIRTGAGLYRNSEKYWKNGPGIGPETADYLRDIFPSIKTVGIDTISITSFSSREIGRQVHKEFLCHENSLLLIEDMNLEVLNNTKPLQVIALPLRIEGADGAPCTVVAKYI